MVRIAVLCTLAVLAPLAAAQRIDTRDALDAFLDDTQLLEDFEGISVHGGSVVPVPNPFNSDTTPALWGVLPGVSYASAGDLMLYGGYVDGDDSNLLEATNGMSISFDEPQAAVGFDAVNPTGNVTRTLTVSFMHNATEVGQIIEVLGPGDNAFVGWQSQFTGITGITIQATATSPGSPGFLAIDNTEWGLPVVSCAADFAEPFGVLNFFDVSAFIADYNKGADTADLAAPFGTLNFFDVSAFIGAYNAGCP